jgi:uncharacterized protein
MGSAIKSRGIVAAVATCVSLALLLPANAQFWGDSWGGRQHRQQNEGWGFGNWGWGDRAPRRPRNPVIIPRYHHEREAPVDHSRAPPASPRKDATLPIVVMGDAMADWLAYGLEDALSEKPEFGVIRKHRSDSGLIRYDHRRENVTWAQAAREIIAADKPKFIVMMVGNNDRQSIRERPPVAPARPPAAKPNAQPAPQGQNASPSPTTPPNQAQQDSELPPPDAKAKEEPAPVPMTEQGRLAAYGPWPFRSEKWELAYIKRIDAAITAMKSAGVPVIWVGLPAQRGGRATQDAQYLNDIYKSRAEKAGIIYVDIWDGFVDESGRFSAQGPDYEGQIRRLRTGDGVYFTKYGARKLAHYVEREIQRSVVHQAVPVALPSVEQGSAPNAKPGAPAQRPAVGPVLSLTNTNVGSEELLGGRAPVRPVVTDPVAARVLNKGEAIAGPTGRADDFSWPPKSPERSDPAALVASPPAPASAAQPQPAQAAATDAKPPQAQAPHKKRRASYPRRPPVAFNPGSFFRGLFR